MSITPTTEMLGWLVAGLLALGWGVKLIYPRFSGTTLTGKTSPLSDEALTKAAALIESEGAEYLMGRLNLPKDVIEEIKDYDFKALAGFIIDAKFLNDWISFDELALILDTAVTVKKACETDNNRDPTAAELAKIQSTIWKALETKPLTTMAQIRAARTGSLT